MTVTLAQQMVRTVAIFQGLLALPILFVTAGFAMNALGYQSPRLYDFTASMFLSLCSAGIIFAVWVQYKVPMSRKVTLYFEIAKSASATAIWLWLILDAAFGPGIQRYYQRNYPRKPMVIRAAISVFILFILLYPTLVWAYIDRKVHGEGIPTPEREEAQNEEAAGEREPLLR